MTGGNGTYRLTVSTPEGNVFSDEVISVMLRGVEGDLAVLAGHIPFATAVKQGALKIEKADGSSVECEIGGGLLTVGDGNTTLMAGSFKVK